MTEKPVMAVAPCRGRARAPSRAARTQSASRLTSAVVRISHRLTLRGRPSSHSIISPITPRSGTTRAGGAVRAAWVSARVRLVDPPPPCAPNRVHRTLRSQAVWGVGPARSLGHVRGRCSAALRSRHRGSARCFCEPSASLRAAARY
ncbi:hypothetical protein HETIRDRAFT_453396 [Heterobasidion irregulare TC 32-1]|uniref:Uncharacterized protein n=1 Tax=Heterobasidion irregulare (strain TC 32-1) TaxID=747525 RepID=W4JZE2_HETIT|nr:uncharacterized protein HETIRDRAFT_453396 [Heterobasidion irregulare TC 32-1]ETW78824.1 hypothetical protein HETIRDRAFT_453396 [Heterobasidion irregulare TC 32-1]